MSAIEQIGKLQGLLARIQKNAARPRASAPTAFGPTATTPAPVFAAPAHASARSHANQSVDDLLGASPTPSPIPLEVDVPLHSVPPVAEVATSPSPSPDAEPVPLVSVSAPQAAPPPPIDDAFSLESEVSEVRVTTATREPEAEVTVAAIAAEAEPIGTEELSEDDLVEVTEGTPQPAGTDVDIDFEDEEQPPASSKRSRVASSMDEALAAAARHEAEREVPIKTPPPESGPQEAPPPMGLAAPAVPDVHALLGDELDIPTRSEVAVAAAPGPTTEQLGQTIELEEARGPSLELAEQQAANASAPVAVEELEVALPSRDIVGNYDESLQPPPEALNDLEAHRRRLEDDIPPPPESLAQLPSIQPGQPVAEIVPIQAAPVEPEVIARPLPMGSPESFGSVRETFRPSSFVELLDASLALSGE
jgi:hypothetical protein